MEGRGDDFMTWRTHMGDRVLKGVEAEVYLTAMQDAIASLPRRERESGGYS